jgi:hypothetical protein
MFNVEFWMKNSKSNIKNSKLTSGLQSRGIGIQWHPPEDSRIELW